MRTILALLASGVAAVALVCLMMTSSLDPVNAAEPVDAVTTHAIQSHVQAEIATVSEFTNTDLTRSIRAFCNDEYLTNGKRHECSRKQTHYLGIMQRVYATARKIVDDDDALPFELKVVNDVLECRNTNRNGLTDWERTWTCATAVIEAGKNEVAEVKLRIRN